MPIHFHRVLETPNAGLVAGLQTGILSHHRYPLNSLLSRVSNFISLGLINEQLLLPRCFLLQHSNPDQLLQINRSGLPFGNSPLDHVLNSAIRQLENQLNDSPYFWPRSHSASQNHRARARRIVAPFVRGGICRRIQTKHRRLSCG